MQKNIIVYGLRSRHVILLIYMLVMCYPVVASDKSNGHFIRLSVDIAYTNDLNPLAGNAGVVQKDFRLAEVNTMLGAGLHEPLVGSNGVGTAFSVGYRRAWQVMLLDVGVGFNYRWVSDKMPILTAEEEEYDEEQQLYTGCHSWQDRRQLRNYIGAELPLMVGAQWSGVYFLVGVKGAFAFWSNSAEKNTHSLRASYEKYVSDFVNMPNHGFVDREQHKYPAVSIAGGYDLRACAEVGYMFSGDSYSSASTGGFLSDDEPKGKITTVKPIYSVSAFVEYGFIGQTDYCPLLAGVRLSLLFRMKDAKGCVCYRW